MDAAVPRAGRRLALLASCLLVTACAPPGALREEAAVGEVLPDPESLLADADAALERGELPEAAQAYRQAAEVSVDESVAEQAARVAFENHQYHEAALAADRWLVLNDTSEQAHRYAGVAALRLHRLDVAEEHFAFLLGSAYISPAAGFLALAPVIADQGTEPDVTELLRRLSVRYPNVAEGYYTVGSAALRSENFALALASAAEATRRAPYWRPAKMLLGRAQIAAGQEEQGFATLRGLGGGDGSELGPRLEYALLLLGTGRNVEARAALAPLVNGERVSPEAVRAMGLLELEEGDLDAAQRRFEQLAATGAGGDEASFYLGTIAERRGDPERAQRQYARVTSGDLALAAQARVARLKAQAGGIDAGLAHLDEYGRSKSVQPGPDLVTARAGLLSTLGDEARALQVLDEGLAQYPDSLELHTARAFLYERTDRVDAAVRELRELLRERPGDAVVQNALGYILADRTRQADEALALVTAALAQTPDSGAVLDSMGWALHRKGRGEEALAYLRKARERSSDPEIDLHIGEVQWGLGERDAALETWQRALERAPDNAKLKERLERAKE